MAKKIDMTQNAVEKTAEQPKEEVIANNMNETKIEESGNGEQPETKPASAELINNATEKTENHNEPPVEKTAEQPKENGGAVIVTYIGGGTWRDAKGQVWANEDHGDTVLHQRQYSKDEYDSREDIKFMVQYKSMTMIAVK